MDKIMYYCPECHKLYKVSGAGKRVKCTGCASTLADLQIADTEYDKLDAVQKKELKLKAERKQAAEDTDIKLNETNVPVNPIEKKDVPDEEPTAEIPRRSSFFDIDDGMDEGMSSSFTTPIHTSDRLSSDQVNQSYFSFETESKQMETEKPKGIFKMNTARATMDEDKVLSTSNTISWILCFFPLIVFMVAVVCTILNINTAGKVFRYLFIGFMCYDSYMLTQIGSRIGLGWEFLGLLFPPVYLFKKAKVLDVKKTCAIVSLIIWLLYFLIFGTIELLKVFLDRSNDPQEISTLSDEELTREYTYDYVTFKVGSDWEEKDEREGMFVLPGGGFVYSILGTSELGAGYDADGFYKELVDLYMKEGNVIDSADGESMKPYVTANGIDGYVGRISMNQNIEGKYDLHTDVDVLVLPTKNYVVTFTAQCNKENALPVDIRKITDTAKIDIAMEDVTEGSSFFDENTNSLLDLTDSEHFVNYLDADNKDGMYAEGTYEVYRGEEAVEKAASMTEYGLTREELETTINDAYNGYVLYGSTVKPSQATKTYFVCKDDFYAIVFNIEGFQDENGNKSDSNKQEVLYIGYYVEELDMLDMMNCKNITFYRWERQ